MAYAKRENGVGEVFSPGPEVAQRRARAGAGGGTGLVRREQHEQAANGIDERRPTDGSAHAVSTGGHGNGDGSEAATQPAEGVQHPCSSAALSHRDSVVE